MTEYQKYVMVLWKVALIKRGKYNGSVCKFEKKDVYLQKKY